MPAPVPPTANVPGDHAGLLRQHGLSVTAQRLAVLRAVTGEPHRSADDICTSVRTDIGAVSRQAVYDTLAVLTDKGVLRRIQPAGSSARYEDRVGDNHHHLVCRNCGAMVDVDCAVGDTPCLTPTEGAGYALDEAEVFYWGTCPRCTTPRSHPPQHPPPPSNTPHRYRGERPSCLTAKTQRSRHRSRSRPARTRTGIGGRISSTYRCSTPTRPRATRWTTTTTTPRRSRASTSRRSSGTSRRS